jgi:hypothetical protein
VGCGVDRGGRIMYIDDFTLWRLIKAANVDGYNNKRIIDIKKCATTASDDPIKEFIFLTDDGPKTASESW